MRITKPVGFGVGIVSLWLPVPSVSGICSQAVHSDDTGHLVSPVVYPALGELTRLWQTWSMTWRLAVDILVKDSMDTEAVSAILELHQNVLPHFPHLPSLNAIVGNGTLGK
jgi:hypothetical protein